MRIVVDTNVVISAYLFPNSRPSSVLEHWLTGDIQLVVSEQLIVEYERVLQYAHIRPRLGMDDASLRRSVERFKSLGDVVEVIHVPAVIHADPDDDVVVATAIAGNADFIVSGDRHLLELGEYNGIRFIPPTMLLVLLETDL